MSHKHRDFLSGRMGDKDVTKLPGIGVVAGRKLTKAGFDKACVVLGQFLLLKKNYELFDEWLKDISNTSVTNSAACYLCLKDWCDEFL